LVDDGEKEGCNDHANPADDVDEGNDDFELRKSLKISDIHVVN
jgi:hypothetical protein